MSVYLIYRTPYNIPNQKYYRRFPEETVLEWFQSLWDFYEEDGDTFYGKVIEYLGIEMYGFWSTFYYYNDSDIYDDTQLVRTKPPESLKQLSEWIYFEGDIDSYENHLLQVLTDDDELELAYYIFDDHFVNKFPVESQFFIQNEFALPTGYKEGKGIKLNFFSPFSTKRVSADVGYVYCFFFMQNGGSWIRAAPYNSLRLDGIRLPDFREYLIQNSEEELHLSLLLLRTYMGQSLEEGVNNLIKGERHAFDYFSTDIREKLTDVSPEEAREMIPELLELIKKNTKFPRHKAQNTSFYQLSDHLLQIALNHQSWKRHPVTQHENLDLYEHWIIFDDLWAASNEQLAHSILNYASGWKIFNAQQA